MLPACLVEKNSIIQVPPELKLKMDEAAARIKEAEEKNKWRDSLISFTNLYSDSQKQMDLDTPFEFGENYALFSRALYLVSHLPLR